MHAGKGIAQPPCKHLSKRDEGEGQRKEKAEARKEERTELREYKHMCDKKQQQDQKLFSLSKSLTSPGQD